MTWWKSLLLAILLLVPPGTVAVGERLQRYPRRMAEVDPGRLYRGGFPSEKHLYLLHDDFGIRTIISLTGDDTQNKHLEERRVATNLGMGYLRFPMPGDGCAAYGDLDRAADALALTLQSPEKCPIYYHCAAGKQRSNALLAAYRLRKCGWTLDRTLAELKTRYDLDPEKENKLIEHLRGYDKWLEAGGYRTRPTHD